MNWVLNDFGYSSIYDEQLDKDLETILSYINDLASYKGIVKENLPSIIEKEISLSLIQNKVFGYLHLLSSVDVENKEISKKLTDYSNHLSQKYSDIEFLSIEMADISEEELKEYMKIDILKYHKKILEDTIKHKKYQLPEIVEQILTKTSGYVNSPWSTLIDEVESAMRFRFESKDLTQVEILEIINNDEDSERRFSAMKVFSDTLTNKNNSISYRDLSVKCMNNLMGYSSLMRKERGYKYPMESRNYDNDLDKEIVDSLHYSVKTLGSVQASRYYKILGKLLGKEILNWSDRNAKPIKNVSDSKISWDDAKDKVLNSLESFSPRMKEIAQSMFDNNRIDYEPYQGKDSGAFSYSMMIPDKNLSYILMNYMGTERCCATLIHELGHSIHGLLSEESVGALQHHAPMSICETASIFSEMLLFEEQIKKTTDKREKLSILLDKCNDWINTVVRQISFSEFEKAIHSKREDGELLPDDFDDTFLEITKEFYGDMFNYDYVAPLWSYISHFRRPFYVYSYAFGELFTQSLFAVKNIDNFENKYIEMLSKGSTETAEELMKPFGLNPKDKEFWNNGINISITKWLDEIEQLIKEMNL